ncbi:TM2 domain containing protein [Aphelenchoides fujianensis]|nr:TM2 domain containing protein [Aphelenchoides fujianensis]
MAVDEHERDEKPKPRQRPAFSIGRSFVQIAYGWWLGFLSVFLAAFLFTNTTERLGLSMLVSFAVASGVYIAGCCGRTSCNFLHAWLAAMSTSTFTLYLSDAYTCRSILLIALAATLNSNRSIEWKVVSGRVFALRHYAFWTSIFFTQMCILILGFSRLSERQIAFTPRSSSTPVMVVPFRRLVADYFVQSRDFNRSYPVRDHVVSFLPMPPRHFKRKPLEFAWNAKPKAGKEDWGNPPHVQFANLFRNFNFDLEFTDDHAHISEFHWLRHLQAFTVDCIRMQLLNDQLGRREHGEEEAAEREFPYPVRWALWRQFLIVVFDLDPFVRDSELSRACGPHMPRTKVMPSTNEEKPAVDWAQMAKSRACVVFEDALKED